MDIENLIGTTSSVPIPSSYQNIKHISLSFFTDALDNLKGISGFSETEFKISQIIANILDALVNFFINKDGEIFFFSFCFIVIFMTIALTGVFVGLMFHFFKRSKPDYNNVIEESFYISALDEFLKPSAPPLRHEEIIANYVDEVTNSCELNGKQPSDGKSFQRTLIDKRKSKLIAD